MINFKYMGKKLEKSINFGHKNGLHIRPGQIIKSISEKLLSEIHLFSKKKNSKVNIKKDGLIEIILLEIIKGDELILTAEGEDAENAIDIMEYLLARDPYHIETNINEELEIIKNKNWNEKIKKILVDSIINNKPK